MSETVSHPICCLTGGILTLEPKCSWLGSGLGTKMSVSRRVHTDEYHPVCQSPVSMSQQWDTVIPASTGDPPKPPDMSGSRSYQITAFALNPSACEILCAFFKTEVLISPNPMEQLQSNLQAFKDKCSEGASSQCWMPRRGAMTQGLELSFLWKNLCNTIVIQTPGRPPMVYGIWLYSESISCTHLIVVPSLYL